MLKDNSGDILRRLDTAVLRALEAIGMTAQMYVAGKAPVDTGRLRNSITYQVEAATNTVHVGTNVEYARYVEEGTYKQRAQPYLRPGITDHIDEYQRIAELQLKKS